MCPLPGKPLTVRRALEALAEYPSPCPIALITDGTSDVEHGELDPYPVGDRSWPNTSRNRGLGSNSVPLSLSVRRLTSPVHYRGGTAYDIVVPG